MQFEGFLEKQFYSQLHHVTFTYPRYNVTSFIAKRHTHADLYRLAQQWGYHHKDWLKSFLATVEAFHRQHHISQDPTQAALFFEMLFTTYPKHSQYFARFQIDDKRYYPHLSQLDKEFSKMVFAHYGWTSDASLKKNLEHSLNALLHVPKGHQACSRELNAHLFYLQMYGYTQVSCTDYREFLYQNVHEAQTQMTSQEYLIYLSHILHLNRLAPRPLGQLLQIPSRDVTHNHACAADMVQKRSRETFQHFIACPSQQHHHYSAPTCEMIHGK